MSEYEFKVQRAMPVLPLRGLAVFPGMLLNFDVERPMSAAALNLAMSEDQIIFLTAQKDLAKDVPFLDDIYHIGTVCRVRQMLRQPGGKTIRVMVEGIGRGRIVGMITDSPCLYTEVEPLPDMEEKPSVRIEALCRRCVSLYSQYLQASDNLLQETLVSIMANTDPKYISNFVAQNTYLKPEEKQQLLEELRPSRRLARLCQLVQREITLQGIERDISESTQEQMNRNQREYYLREQMKVIQSELGEDDTPQELDEYRSRIRELHLAEDVEKKLLKEVSRLSRQPFGSAEASVIRGYLDTCLEVPWNTTTKETLDIEKARKILDEDHYGLEKVKERIIEFLAVRKLAPNIRGTVLCLVGPPGTGKTSIARSIARALDKKYVRISLGGVRDEAEIRGHRRTYVGAMPGRIVNGLRMAGVKNPLMLLDEIDKMSSDYKGDTASAMLEVLDSEQNHKFRDHYVELPVDLSEVLFIASANSMQDIPGPLLDRMEIIEVSSYTENEKFHIAKDHLLAKQFEKNGVADGKLKITDKALRMVISSYTREAGVRSLERQIGEICRKAARRIYEGDEKMIRVTGTNLEDFLGKPKYRPEKKNKKNEVGIVRGLAWTSVGGVTLEIEVNLMPGKGSVVLTGKLGDVMKESAQTGISYIRSISEDYHIDPEFFQKHDIHIHVPEGAVPKDGPSAGITMATAILSAVTGKLVRADVAMTGEITLRGRVLPIGGLKEKLLAAKNAGMKTVCIPKENEQDLAEISEEIVGDMEIIPVEHMDQVIKAAFV